MSDNLRRYCAIRDALRQLSPRTSGGAGGGPTGNYARHLQTLAHLVSGVVGSKRSNLPAIASKAPGGTKRESRIKRYSRWLTNERITAQDYYLPYVQILLSSLPAEGPLVLMIDGSAVGRGCQALVISVLYKKRALPLAWSVVRGKKGALSEQMHRHLVEQVAAMLPMGRKVVFLGDGEFNGVELLDLLQRLGWLFVCRIAKNTLLCEEGKWFSLDWLTLQPGEAVEMADVLFTAREFGPVLVAAVWRRGCQEPLYLLSNLDFLDEACAWYRKRFTIETFFSDQKSRGFYLSHSHLWEPMRMQQLRIATCLAYLWMVCLGALVVCNGWLPRIHRRDRCDLSMFQIGLLWVEHCLGEGEAVPVTFRALRRAVDVDREDREAARQKESGKNVR